MLSTIAHSNNMQCNYLQVIMDFFMEAKNAPDAVREVTAHGGWCISQTAVAEMIESVRKEHVAKLATLGKSTLTSMAYDNLEMEFNVGEISMINHATHKSITTGLFFQLEHGVVPEDLKRPGVSPASEDKTSRHSPNRHPTPPATIWDAIPSESALGRIRKGMVWVIGSILVETLALQHKHNLGEIPSNLQIPVKKTHHKPAFAMHSKCSGNDSNIEVLDKMMGQSGITEDIVRHFVLLVHGDLGVLERVKSVLASRKIERTDKESFEYVETVPGLFHVLMACADAIWRTYIEPKDLHKDRSGVYQQFCDLYPKKQAKLTLSAPFRMLHDGIDHILTARILDCSRIICGKPSIEEFKKTEPTWERIHELSEEICTKFLEQHDESKPYFSEPKDKDATFKNGRLFNRDALLYRVLALATRYGAIGLVEDALTVWVPIFKGTRKHKYATHILNFLTRLKNLPPRLSRAIRLNWLCNPSGRYDGFRAIDWLVELNNLYIKVSTSSRACVE